MKVIILLAVLTTLTWLVWKSQSPESYLKKKTQKLIAMTSNPRSSSEIALISKMSKIARFIHFDVRLKAEYKGQIWTAKSLNEFRSLLFSYFKQEKNKPIGLQKPKYQSNRR